MEMCLQVYDHGLAVFLISKQYCSEKIAGDPKENFVYNSRQTKNAITFA